MTYEKSCEKICKGSDLMTVCPKVASMWSAKNNYSTHEVSANSNKRAILLSTEDEELVEDTTGWHDNIWGDCSCPKCQYIKGRNKLGKILMQVRDEIKTDKMQHP